tara:strand:- start:3025 stop:3264 length:240 start_codon:yes stop_codon:yes gene_type:complete
MALTVEELKKIEYREAEDAGRRTHELASQSKAHRMDLLRLARETLVENRRIEPAETAKAITATDIITYATTLENYIKGS